MFTLRRAVNYGCALVGATSGRDSYAMARGLNEGQAVDKVAERLAEHLDWASSRMQV